MKGRLVRLPEVQQGRSPTEFFYGAVEMARAGHDVSHWEIDPSEAPRLSERLLGRLWPASARPVKMEPGTVTQVLRRAAEFNRADCLVATGGNIAFALAALSCVGVIRKPILGIQCGVLHFRYNAARRRISAALLRRMHTILFGEAELQPMRRFFDLPENVISVSLFGVDTRFWQPGPAGPRDLVLAIGNDGRRDFQTLIDAAPGIPAPIHIVTKLPLPSNLPSNVVHHHGSWHGTELSDERIRELYRRARVVVVPLHPNGQPSGQSVTLQAMACGCPVVLTETEGLWSRAQMRDGENILFTPPGDGEALASRVRTLLADPQFAGEIGRASRAFAELEGSIETFAATMEDWCAHLASAGG